MEHLFLYVTCSVIILIGFFGCAHSDPSDTPQERAHAFLSRAAEDAVRGDFEHAFKKNEIALQRYSEMIGDQALYQRSLFHLHSKNPNKNNIKATDCFKKLRDRFPDSRLSAEAETWLITLEALEQQNIAIQALKTEAQNNQDTLRRLTHNNNTLKTRISNLKAKIRLLENQIEELKQVDLGIEERKRESAEH
jgi:TolA-binding protein